MTRRILDRTCDGNSRSTVADFVGRVAASTAVLALLATLVPTARPAAAEDLNRVVMRINNQIVTLHEYEVRKSSELARILGSQQLGATERQEQLEKVGQEVMQSLFGELLLLSFAEQQGIRIRDAEVDEALLEMQQRQGISSRADLDQALQTVGMTYEQWKESTRREMIWSQVVGREVNSKVEVGEEELRAYYRNNPSQFEVPERRELEEIIVLESSGLDDDALRQRAAEVHRELADGAELAELATRYQGEALTTGVIELGWLERGEIDETLEDAAWQLAEGEYSAPVNGRGGYHILHLKAREEASVRPYDEVENWIMRRERSRRFQKELRDFLADLETKAHIVENLPPEAVGYRRLATDMVNEDALGGFFSDPLEQVQDELGSEAPDDGEAGEEGPSAGDIGG